MDSPTIEKLKNNISMAFVNSFPLEILQEEMFIPINSNGENIYVGMVDAGNTERKKSVLAKIAQKTRLRPKVLNLTQDQFYEIFNTCKNYHHHLPELEDLNFDRPINLTPVNIQLEEFEDVQPKKKLGEQLIEDGLISKEQLARALAQGKQLGIPIGSALVKLGFITLEQLRETLAKQQGIDFIETKNLKIEPEVIKLLPEDFIKDNKVVPISTDGKTINIGMVNPNDRQTLNDIIYLTGLRPKPSIVTHIEFERYVKSYIETKRETEKLVEEISLDNDMIVVEENLWQLVEKELESESSNLVAKFASSIISEAIEKGASDIHIEPRNDGYIVRYRIDGILRKVLEVPQKIEASLLSRLKVTSRMNIAEHRRPQDGHFTLKYNNRPYDLRINTLPVGLKEKMVIRILQPDLRVSSEDRRIQLVGATKEDIYKIDLMTKSPHGIILTTGPTGSGKTTTLYSIINKVNNESVNITTIEDPVEIKLDGINQVQVNPKAEVTFASCLRAILRQDPDIIMVGEIRDFETLKAGIHAALTGHLVLSTVHTNSAASTVTRLIEMGAADHLISSSLIGVIAQRLVRRLCPECKETYKPSLEELQLILPQTEDVETFMQTEIYKAKGCEQCSNTGYIGRMGLYEIMPINREIKKMISQSCTALEIEEVAISCGMKTLQRAGLDAILNGQITVEEYLRVLGAVSD